MMIEPNSNNQRTITSGEGFSHMKNALLTFENVKKSGTLGAEYFDYYELYLITTYIRKYREYGLPNFAEEIVVEGYKSKPNIVKVRDHGHSLMPLDLPVFYMKPSKSLLDYGVVKDRFRSILEPVWTYLNSNSSVNLKSFLNLPHEKARKAFLTNSNNVSSNCFIYAESMVTEVLGRPGEYSSIKSLIVRLEELWGAEKRNNNNSVLIDNQSRLTIVSRYFSITSLNECKKQFFANVLLNYLVLLIEQHEKLAVSSEEKDLDLVLEAAFERELSIMGRLNLVNRFLESDKWSYLIEKYHEYKGLCVNSARQWLVFLVEEQSDYRDKETDFKSYLENRFIQFISSSTRLSQGHTQGFQYVQIPSVYKQEVYGRMNLGPELKKPLEKALTKIPGLLNDWEWILKCSLTTDVNHSVELNQEQCQLLSFPTIESLYKQFTQPQNGPELRTEKADNIKKRLQEWLCFLLMDRDFENYKSVDLKAYIHDRAEEFVDRCRQIITDIEAGNGLSENYYFASFRWEYIPLHYRVDGRRRNKCVHKQYTESDICIVGTSLSIENMIQPPQTFFELIKENKSCGHVSKGLFTNQYLLSLWDKTFGGEDEMLFVLFVLYYALFVDKPSDDVSSIDKAWKEATRHLDQRFTKSVDFFQFLEHVNEYVLRDRKEVIEKIDHLNYKPYCFKNGCGQNSKLGTGAYGSVFHCEDLALQRDVVVKLIVPSLNNSEEHEKLKEEARILASMRHDGIVDVYSLIVLTPDDYQLTEDSCYLEKPPEIYGIVMEYIPESQTLDRYLDENSDKLTRDEKITLFQKICYGVQAVHDKRDHTGKSICHGDIKPDNILVDLEGNPYLIDFGISSKQGSNPKGLGSELFCSAKRLGGSNVSIGDDIFSLGVLLLYLLLGDRFISNMQTVDQKKQLFCALVGMLSRDIESRYEWLRSHFPFVPYDEINDKKFVSFITRNRLISFDFDYLSFLSDHTMFNKIVVSALVNGFDGIDVIKAQVQSDLLAFDKTNSALEEFDFGFDEISAVSLGGLCNCLREVRADDFCSVSRADLFGQKLTVNVLDTLFHNVDLKTVLNWLKDNESFEVKLVAINKSKLSDAKFSSDTKLKNTRADAYVLITRDNNTKFYKLCISFPKRYESFLNNEEDFILSSISTKQLLLFSLLESLFIKWGAFKYSGYFLEKNYSQDDFYSLCLGLYSNADASETAENWLSNLYRFYDFEGNGTKKSQDYISLKSKLDLKLESFLSNEIIEWKNYCLVTDKYWARFTYRGLLAGASRITMDPIFFRGRGFKGDEDILSVEVETCCRYIMNGKVRFVNYNEPELGMNNSLHPGKMFPVYSFVEFMMTKYPGKFVKAYDYISDFEIYRYSKNWPCFLDSEFLQVKGRVLELDFYDLVSSSALVELTE